MSHDIDVNALDAPTAIAGPENTDALLLPALKKIRAESEDFKREHEATEAILVTETWTSSGAELFVVVEHDHSLSLGSFMYDGVVEDDGSPSIYIEKVVVDRRAAFALKRSLDALVKRLGE